jgi:hypothetical protein
MSKQADRIGVPYPVAVKGSLVLRAVGHNGDTELCRHDADTFRRADKLCRQVAEEWGSITGESLPAFGEEVKRRLEK